MAGAIHTGLLPKDGMPDRDKLWKLPFMNLKSGDGKIISLGKDGQGDKVYALSVKGDREMIYRLIDSFMEISGMPAGELYLVDSCAGDNILLLAGSVLCRSNLLAPLGRHLATAGIKKSYGRLSSMVKCSKLELPELRV
ncbi:MAG: hypothetical protein A4E53_01019 [Pelotomaculum sp. PtaB.Bin104]|nr:MAG: hypothetical protein A4E53_01019 [Pelotomaculum sp. PtaB.Bin104]